VISPLDDQHAEARFVGRSLGDRQAVQPRANNNQISFSE
jgi:hypothetical protein